MKRIMISFMALGLLLVSCKKEKTSESASNLDGTYTFKYITATSTGTLTASDGEKLVSTLDYTTIDNKGTIVLAGSNITSSGLGYSVNSEMKTSFYMNNELVDTDADPFLFTIPVTSASSTYKLVGSDSIYFPEGGFISGLSPDGNTPLGASGGHYTFDGKTLTLFQNISRTSSYTEAGYTYNQIQTAIGSVILEKQ